MTIHEKLATIQTKFKSKKSRYNAFGKYNFRSAEDILEATKPYLLELGVSVVVSERLLLNTGSDFPILESKATITEHSPLNGTLRGAIEATAIVGVDLAQKGMQMPQKFGSASSYGKKYALGNLFLIDDTADADAMNDHKGSKAPKPDLKGDALEKAVKAVKAGSFTLDDVKKKYNVSATALKSFK